jgi:hypothetical protein
MSRRHLSVAVVVGSLCANLLQAQGSTPADTGALLQPLNRLLTAFNAHADLVPKGIFTDDATVVDVISPFVWTGPGAVARWYDALLGRSPASPRANDLVTLDQHLTIGPLESVQIADDYAMFVVPAVATYLDHGARQRQVARWFLTERRVAGEWRISAHVFDVTG